MTKIGLVLAAAAAASLSGCATYAYSSKSIGNAFIYADTRTSETATSQPVGPKTGEACSKSILGIVTTGDATIVSAAKNGGITKVATVDNHYSNILGVVSDYCVVVTGQ